MNIFQNFLMRGNNYRLPSKIIDYILEKTYYKRQGIFLHWLFTKSWFTLMILFFIIHLCVAIVFSSYYLNKGAVYSRDSSGKIHQETNLGVVFIFSLINQTTMSHGVMAFSSPSRFAVAAQAMYGLIFNALAFGIILARIIRRGPKIDFAHKILCQNEKPNKLYFRIWNRDAFSYASLDIKVYITRRVEFPVPPYTSLHTFPVLLDI